MSAPKRPVSTGTPSSARNSQNRSKSCSACSGAAATENPGRLPLAPRGIRRERELTDDKRAPRNIADRSVHPTFVVLEYPQFRDFRGQSGRHVFVVIRYGANEYKQAFADASDCRIVYVEMG